jgi:hypothetical protein
MTLAEAIETTRIHSVAGLTGDRTALVTTRPFRAPHHTISDAGLIGGGHVPMPGEGSRAHQGILFLDELPEFRRHVLEVLTSCTNRSRRVFYIQSFASVRILLHSRLSPSGSKQLISTITERYRSGDSRWKCLTLPLDLLPLTQVNSSLWVR